MPGAAATSVSVAPRCERTRLSRGPTCSRVCAITVSCTGGFGMTPVGPRFPEAATFVVVPLAGRSTCWQQQRSRRRRLTVSQQTTAAPAQPARPAPPTQHQLALMIWVAVFPTLTVLNLTMGPQLRELPVVARTLVLATLA